MKKRSQLPRTLAILPGRRWVGKLRVLQAAPEVGRYIVEFDAESPLADPQERYVYDRTTMSAKEIAEWTGIDLLAS
jgi:hypothetical protein